MKLAEATWCFVQNKRYLKFMAMKIQYVRIQLQKNGKFIIPLQPTKNGEITGKKLYYIILI